MCTATTAIRGALGTLLLAAIALVPFTSLAGHITQIIDATGDGVNPLDYAFGIAVDSAGNVYVTGVHTDNAFRIEPDGAITQIIDSTGDGANPFDSGNNVAVDGSGNVYVAGLLSDNAFRIEPGGAITEIIDASGDGANALDNTFGIALDGSGNVYVVGAVSDNAFRIEPGGAITQIIDATGDGVNPLDTPFGVAVDGSGNAYVTAAASDNVFRIEPGGAITQLIDATGDGLNPFDFGFSAAVDGSGNVYVSGTSSDNVFKIEPGGAITQIIDASGDGVNPLDVPRDLALDGSGNVYVAGGDSDNVFRIDPGGEITQIMDATGDGVNPLIDPRNLALDGSGHLYVAGLVSSNAFKIVLPRDTPVSGRRLLIKNKIPDDTSKNRIAFLSRDPSIAVRSSNDPRDLTSFQSTLVVSSASSGEFYAQTLPPENWRLVGREDSPRGYRYLDRDQSAGHCKHVRVLNGKRANAVCRGVSYDLEEGQLQAPVKVTLRIGQDAFCSEFGGTLRRDGTNGRTFYARDSVATSCTSVCEHDKCETGAPLDPTCDPCVAVVCSLSPECCRDTWDSSCVADAGDPVLCHHDPCS